MGRHRFARAGAAVAAVGFAIWMLPAGPAVAATFNVSNTNDSGPGSLRQAVADASAAAGADTVVIPAGLGTITLSSTIDFSGTDLTTVQGNNNTVSYAPGTAFNSNFTTPYALDGLVITADTAANTYNGALTVTNCTIHAASLALNTYGGALGIADSAITSDASGANTYSGSLTVSGTTMDVVSSVALNTYSGDVKVTNSTIRSSGGGSGVNTYDGGIEVSGSEIAVGGEGINSYSGPISITMSSVIGVGASAGVGVDDGSAAVTIVNSTVTGWSEVGVDAGSVTLVYSTIVDNGTGDGVNIYAGDLYTFGSVLTSGADDCNVSSTTSHGYNFSNDTTCGLTATGDVQSGGSPGLGALADNGGNSRTFLPQSGSPLIDAIPLASCQSDGAAGVTTDQRGLPRPAELGCEIGSVEVQPPPPPPVITTTTTTTRAPSAAVVTPRFTG